jgi:hypothetical protein
MALLLWSGFDVGADRCTFGAGLMKTQTVANGKLGL